MSALAHQLPTQVAKPHLRLLPPYVPARPSPAIYRRRRLAVGGIALLVLITLVALIGEVSPLIKQPQLNAVAIQSKDSRNLSIQEWTLRPGDTLWGIAQAIQPKGDIRPLLDQLIAKYGSSPLRVGDTIAIPSPD